MKAIAIYLLAYCLLLVLHVLLVCKRRNLHRAYKRQKAQSHFLSQIVNASGSLLPGFYEQMQRLVNKSHKLDAQLYAEFHQCIKEYTWQYQESLMQIAQSTQVPTQVADAGLTDREKVVYLLSSLDFSNETTGGLLGASQDNIRSTKSRVARKITMAKTTSPI